MAIQTRNKLVLLLVAPLLLTVNTVLADGHSAFIDNMPALKDKADVPGMQTWEKDGLKASDYTRVVIHPITLFISSKSDYQGIEADEMKAISDRLRKALVDALEPDFPVVDNAGPGVMVVRIAVTNLRLKKKKRGVLGYTPIGFVAGEVTKSAGDKFILSDAGMQWEVLDGASGERIAVAVDINAMQAGKSEGEENWKAIEVALENAAERFRKRVEKDRAR
jgi:hypothetical protein